MCIGAKQNIIIIILKLPGRRNISKQGLSCPEVEFFKIIHISKDVKAFFMVGYIL